MCSLSIGIPEVSLIGLQNTNRYLSVARLWSRYFMNENNCPPLRRAAMWSKNGTWMEPFTGWRHLVDSFVEFIIHEIIVTNAFMVDETRRGLYPSVPSRVRFH